MARLWAAAAGLVAAAVALFALAVRWYEAPAITAGGSGAVMVPATAVGVLLAASALLLLVGPRRRGSISALARLAAVLGMAIGLVVIGQYAMDWWGGAAQPTLPGLAAWWARRPSPLSGLGLAFIGASLLALGAGSQAARRWAGPGAAATMTVALAGLIGHAYGADALYGQTPWGGTGMSTVIALGTLAGGVFLADPSRGIVALAASDSAGGRLLRRLTPAAVLAPFLLGWLAMAAQASGRVHAGFAMALLVVSLIVLLVGLAVRQAVVLDVLDSERERLLAGERSAREQVTSILESITDAFFAVDRQWRFTYVNRDAERLLQRPRTELLGRNLWAEFPAAVGDAFEREYRRAMRTQESAQFEAYFAPLQAWFHVRAYPAADGLSVYFHDVTARKIAEQQLQESEQRYRLLADMIPQHIWITDPDGYHTYFSRRWYEFTGVDPDQSRGEGWLHLVHPDDRERTVARWQHSLRTGEPYVIEYRFLGAEGRYRWFLGQAMPLRNEAGEIVRWFGTLTDISDRKRLEHERERLLREEQRARAESERQRAELERVTESRASLMRGFGHDVKNPLSAAHVHAQLLEMGKIPGTLSARQRDSVRLIRRSIRTAVQLIDDLLELARAEAGQLELACADTDVGQVAREAAEEVREQAMAAELALEMRIPQGLQAHTDPARLRQILSNLLSNAIKYAPNGRLQITAEARARGGPGPNTWTAVDVSDTGPGIPGDKQELVFQEYSRLDPEVAHGVGIGLAISRRIARLMGGDLTVTSEPGQGATFTVWLPPAEEPRNENARHTPPHHGSSTPQNPHSNPPHPPP